MASFVSYGLLPLVIAEAARAAKVRFKITTIPARQGVWFEAKGEVFVPELTATDRAMFDEEDGFTAAEYWNSLATLTDGDFVLGEMECCVLDITDLAQNVADLRDVNADYSDVLENSGLSTGHRALVVGEAMTRSQFRGNKLLNLLLTEVELMFKPSVTLLEALPILPSSERANRRGYGRNYSRTPKGDQESLMRYYKSLGFVSTDERPSVMFREPAVVVDTAPFSVPSVSSIDDTPTEAPTGTWVVQPPVAPAATTPSVESFEVPVFGDEASSPPEDTHVPVEYISRSDDDGYYSRFSDQDLENAAPPQPPHDAAAVDGSQAEQLSQPSFVIDFSPDDNEDSLTPSAPPAPKRVKKRDTPSDPETLWSEMSV